MRRTGKPFGSCAFPLLRVAFLGAVWTTPARALDQAGAPPAALVPSTQPQSVIDAEALPRLVLREEQRIGGDDPANDLRRIGAVQVDDGGQLYVFEPSLRQIHVFSPEGTMLRRIGRAGPEPGGFMGTEVTFGFSSDTIWAIDSDLGASRLTYFDREGRLLGTGTAAGSKIELHSSAVRSWIVPLVRGADGLFVGDVGSGTEVLMSPSSMAEPPKSSVRIPRVRFDPQGRVVDTAGYYDSHFHSSATEVLSVGGSTYAVPGPPSDVPLQIREPDGLITIARPTPAAADATFRVTRSNFRRDSLQDVTFRFQPERHRAGVLDSLSFRAARGAGGSYGMLGPSGRVSIRRFPQDSAAARPLIRDAMRFPEFQPPVQGAWRGSDGGLWLKREDTEAETVRWIVLDAQLRPVGQLDLPRSFTPVWSKGDQLWVAETDANGAVRLVRYRVQTTPVGD